MPRLHVVAAAVAAVCLELAGFAAAAHSKIDVHSHFLPEFYQEALIETGHVPGPDGMPYTPEWNISSHLAFMQAANVSKSYLSISSPGVWLKSPMSPGARDHAVDLAQRVNDYASELKAEYPEQIGFFASLPLPDVELALAELDRVYTELSPKPDGVVLMSNYWGMYMADEHMETIYARMGELASNNQTGATSGDFIVFEHPTTPCTTTVGKSLLLGEGPDFGPVNPMEYQMLNRPLAGHQAPAPMLDFPFETARSIADLLLYRIPATFPELKWIFSHAGGNFPALIDRVTSMSTFATGADTAALTEEEVLENFEEYFYFDLAGPVPVEWSVPPLMRWTTHDKLLYGSDVPFTPFEGAALLGSTVRWDDMLSDLFGGDQGMVEDVSSGNAEALFA